MPLHKNLKISITLIPHDNPILSALNKIKHLKNQSLETVTVKPKILKIANEQLLAIAQLLIKKLAFRILKSHQN